MSIFGTRVPAFGSSTAQTTSGLFGASSAKPLPQQSGGGLFGSSTQPQQGGGIFGLSSQPQQSSSLFGSTPQPQQTSSLFGTSTTQPQQTTSLFGASATQPQQTTSLFGTSTSQPQQTGSLFGTAASQPQQTNIFGSPQAQKPFGGFGTTTTGAKPAQQVGGLFGFANTASTQQAAQPAAVGANPQPQQNAGGSLFSLSQQQQPPQQIGSLLAQSQQNRIWTEQDLAPRQRSVPEQIELVYRKWDPYSQSNTFQTYLYNTVDRDSAPFYRPDPSEDEDKWEEALRKRPNPGAIPVLVRGFQQLGHRIINQEEHLRVLHGRLAEINNGLTDLLRRHDLNISTRADACRRKHTVLSQRCLALATKTQVLRNRGYAMDSAEEELRRKLTVLEKNVSDPALNGRSEEIWARMVSVRERGRQLQFEFERAGLSVGKEQGQGMDEETMKRARKILEDYHSQLAHLAKELEQIQKDYAEWEAGRLGNGGGNGR